MDNKKIGKLIKKIRRTRDYENLEDRLGKELGRPIYELISSVSIAENGDPFACGVVYACARLCELYDEPTMAISILKESGVDPRKSAEYDLKFLRKEDATLPRGVR